MPVLDPPAFLVRTTAVTDGLDPSGSPDALARLYGDLVFRAAYRVLGEADGAEDVQQDVFLRLVEQPPRDVASWPAFLTAAAVRTAIDRRRRRQRWQRLLPSWLAQAPAASASAEQAGLDEERARRLRSALGHLSAREAQCFSLRYFESMPVADIARVLGANANSVNVALHRARQRLEALLGDTTPEDRP